MLEADIKSLKIDRSKKRAADEPSPWAKRFILTGIMLFVLAGAGRFVYGRLHAATEVDVFRVKSASSGSAAPNGSVILNATGYIVAHHKIAVASKVVGRVQWIGVEKGDKVRENQVIVRLEDDEYRAQLQQAQGQLGALEARLKEATAGSRPEEIAAAKANVEQAKADLANAEVTLTRTQQLVGEGVLSKQALDDAVARRDAQAARVRSLERTYDLVALGPREEFKESLRAQIVEAKGRVAFFETQLANTIIRAPVTGTILERNVEKGEFVTTGFVGDKGAKGYVVSLADLNDLQVELDINQNDFARLGPKQKASVTTDAFPDRKYEGFIEEISPEANRQKATVQVKVKIVKPDSYLRPDMNASVAFLGDEEPKQGVAAAPGKPVVYVPAAAVRDGAVFVVLGDRAIRRAVRVGGSTREGLRVEDGLIGGEDIVLNVPPELKDGDRVRIKGAAS
jgi:HlyD family secretion protein